MLWEPKREEIRFRRTMMGLSMSGLSKKAGLSVSSVLRIESEITKKVSDLRGREIAKALNCNPEDIFIIPGRHSQTLASNT